MDLLTILLISNIVLLSIIILMLIFASIKARLSIPILFEIYIGLILLMLFIMDSIFANWYLEIGIFGPGQYFSYRYFLEIILGIIGLYIITDINVHSLKKRIILKSLIFIIGTNFITSLLILSLFIPSIDDNSIGLLFLLNTNVPFWVQFIIFGSKVFGLGGLIIFLCYICVLVVKSKLFSRWSNIFIVCGIMSIIDSIITVPTAEVLLNLPPEVFFILWLVTFAFIIAARLNRINIRVMVDVHDLIITHESGIPIFSLTDGKMSPELIGGAMSGLTSLIQEISGSSHKVKAIDQNDIKLLFVFGNHFFITLIVEGESLVLSKMLHRLVHKIESQYTPLLKNFSGDVEVFKSLKELVNSTFSQVEWKIPLEVNK
ncbi:MAG: hypothetical protein P8Y70_14655 [Candidatus Lokiarchaeota archaeon]